MSLISVNPYILHNRIYYRIVASKDARTSDLINSALLVLPLLSHLTYTSAVMNRGSVY